MMNLYSVDIHQCITFLSCLFAKQLLNLLVCFKPIFIKNMLHLVANDKFIPSSYRLWSKVSCMYIICLRWGSQFQKFRVWFHLRFWIKSFNLDVLFTSKMKFIMASSTSLLTRKLWTTALVLGKCKKLD